MRRTELTRMLRVVLLAVSGPLTLSVLAAEQGLNSPSKGIAVAPQTPVQVAKSVFPSTLMVIASDAAGNVVSQGSGIVVGPGQVVTNLHVVRKASSAVVKLIGRKEPMAIDSVLAIDETNDLVLMSVASAIGVPVRISSNDAVDIGSRVFAVGNPWGWRARSRRVSSADTGRWVMQPFSR